MSYFYIADYDITSYQGGAEKVDHTIYNYLGIEYKPTSFLENNYNKNDFYVISNAAISNNLKGKLIENKNYIILEHDYKIHATRQPHRYQNNIFPKQERINYNYYEGAKAVFLQSTDHYDCYILNEVKGNLIKLEGSFWSAEELISLKKHTKQLKNYRYAIIENSTVDKGKDIAIKFCIENNLDYTILPTLPLIKFYEELSKYSTLVYFPRVKESFCRLVVEARALHCNVITNKTYGAVKESWFGLSGHKMIDQLESMTATNLGIIKQWL